MIFVCPNAAIWHEIYERLRTEWCALKIVGDGPPLPLLLAGWIYSSDQDKQDRWNATVRWAKSNALAHLIPNLLPEDCYWTEVLSTSYPEQRYRPDRYAVRDRASDDAVKSALHLLKSDWQTIAGSELASMCQPIKFTGKKARRLLVHIRSDRQPPWGTWTSLTCGPERATFAAFRRRVNEAISPLSVDHIDFVEHTTVEA